MLYVNQLDKNCQIHPFWKIKRYDFKNQKNIFLQLFYKME